MTLDDFSIAVFAQSVGGGGGNGGGTGAYFASLGGDGGGAGIGGDVSVFNTGLIATAGAWSHTVFAQSIGGGGGNGGGSGALWVAIGGDGGNGNHGGAVSVTNMGDLMALGMGARGIHAESIGGSGGTGAGSGALNISIGGDAGAGNDGGNVTVSNGGLIQTAGAFGHSIFAMSVGGGGGSASQSGAALFTLAGDGGAGGDGGAVEVFNTGSIVTLGPLANGIFAQSVGGGGGNGGGALNIAAGLEFSFGIALGGDGGAGGHGSKVSVDNAGSIFTAGSNSHAINAQSIGGAGGAGGNAVSFSAAIGGVIPEVPFSVNASVAIGGDGGGGGNGGEVDVTNTGNIETDAFRSYGILAQSVGGSGGDGGNATSIALSVNTDVSGTVAIGGDGGVGGHGSLITVDNEGWILTRGDHSIGLMAQSVGGTGGTGGDSTTVKVDIGFPTSPEDLIPMPGMSFDISIGGDGGSGGDGGVVDIRNNGSIMTEGLFATAVLAQSVGGGGGAGGDARSFQVDLSANPTDFVPWLDLISFDAQLVFGGSGGGGGSGDTVSLIHGGDIETHGAFAHGIVAQSVGGGGGVGGSALTFSFDNTELLPDLPEVPVLDDIVNLTNLSMRLQGSGGAGGDGGPVMLTSTGNIWTEGDYAMGIVAQSIAGGGGLAGIYNPQGVTGSAFLDSMIGLLMETEGAGISFAGSVGGDGTAGSVMVSHSGDIRTNGIGAHGLFAQSASGLGAAADVSITLDGSIIAAGMNSYGIYAQSEGGLSNGNVTISVVGDGTVMGGSDDGAGVFIAGGADNSLTNFGVITSYSGIEGRAIIAASNAPLAVDNYGIVTGIVDLGGGLNSFDNFGFVNAGQVFDVGAGNQFHNDGFVAPGGMENVLTTNVVGDFLQTGLGTLWFDLDFGSGMVDGLEVDGVAILDGTLWLHTMNSGSIVPGLHELPVILATGGIVDEGLQLRVAPSAVIEYALVSGGESGRLLQYNVDFAPTDLNPNQSVMGEHINAIQLAGGSDEMSPLTATIVSIPDIDSLAVVYDRLSPHIYAANQLSRFYSSLDFERSMHSCPVRDGDMRFSREGECSWMRVSDRDIDYSATDGSLLGTDYSLTINMGLQRALTPHWHGGLAVGMEQSDYDIPTYASREGSQVQVGGIAKGRYGRSLINLSLAGGWGDYTTRRMLQLPGVDDHVTGRRDITFYSAQAGYEYSLENETWFFRPGVAIGWVDVEGDPLVETGGDAASLILAGTDDEYLTSQATMLLGGELVARSQARYRPYLRATYTHILSGTENEIWARLSGAPDSVPYFVQRAGPDDNVAGVGLGLDVLTASGAIVSLAYDWQFATRWESHAFFAKLIFDM